MPKVLDLHEGLDGGLVPPAVHHQMAQLFL
jgi:hypothetical protein